MKKIRVVVPKKKEKKVLKTLKKEDIERFEKFKERKKRVFEIIVTELQSKRIVKQLKEKLDIHIGVPVEEGYISVEPINLIAPLVPDKGVEVELEELILTDAKHFVNLSRKYVVFIAGAAIIACTGLIFNKISILIGAMVIGPLMNPLMAASYGLAKKNWTIIKKALLTEFVGIALIILLSTLMGFLPNPDLYFEKNLVNQDLVLELIIPLVLGVVAATSFMTGKFEMQAGVAISISLIPPITNAVILFMNGEHYFAMRSLYVFIEDLAGMHLSSFLTFVTLGWHEKIKKR